MKFAFDRTQIKNDATLSLDGSHKPYEKPNSTIKYVNKGSNHPPSITKNIPSSIQKRLNSISSCEKEFINAKGEYQKALTDAGYTHELTYDTGHKQAYTHKENEEGGYYGSTRHIARTLPQTLEKISLTYCVFTLLSSILFTTFLTKTLLNYPTHVP